MTFYFIRRTTVDNRRTTVERDFTQSALDFLCTMQYYTGMKSKVDRVLNNLDKIKEWKKHGATDEQICSQLGIKKTSWYKYIKEHSEIADTIKIGIEGFVMELRGELASQCFKHRLETKKSYIKLDLETNHKTQYTEITSKEVDGNISAIHLMLKNLDRNNWKNDWDNYDFRKQELELRKQMNEDKIFGGE